MGCRQLMPGDGRWKVFERAHGGFKVADARFKVSRQVSLLKLTTGSVAT